MKGRSRREEAHQGTSHAADSEQLRYSGASEKRTCGLRGRIVTVVLLSGGILFAGLAGQSFAETGGRRIIDLTYDTTIDLAQQNGYRFMMLNLAMKRNHSNLRAERAALKSKVYMNLKAPEFSAVSDYKWNSTLYRDEIIRTVTRRWQVDISARQPVILLGRPTNGYLSLNNRMYRYLQKEDTYDDVDYYNRFYLEYDQPIFYPNRLKNNIERAELNIQNENLQHVTDRQNEIIGVSFDYYQLFLSVQSDSVYTGYIRDIENIYKTAEELSRDDPSRLIDMVQAEMELANARELRLTNATTIRNRSMRLKQRLRLAPEDSLDVRHDMKTGTFAVDFDRALQYAYTLTPRLKTIEIETRKREIELDNTRGNGAFHMNFEVTLGIENNEDRYQSIWDDYDNSYSVMLSAYIPIWDWGRRQANIDAAKISVKRSQLSMEETRVSMKNDINTAVNNVMDYRRRLNRMEQNLESAVRSYEISISRYREGALSIQGVMKSVERKRDLELNVLDAYYGYRSSLLTLMSRSQFDFETGKTMRERYGL